MNKYSIVDYESDLVIGNCMNIVGLTGSRQYKACNFYELILVGLRLSENYKNHCLGSKTRIASIYINMLSQDEEVLGSYLFILNKTHFFHRDVIAQDSYDLALSGSFCAEPSYEALEIWKQWMVSKPATKNTWSALSQKRRLGWLEVVRMHSATYNTMSTNATNYFLDMTHVSDSVSFYCALGEAMNGPGGYYGSCLNSLHDCFCGGFGATTPFVLHLCNGNFDELMQRNKIKESEQVKLRKLQDVFITKQITLVTD